MLEFFKFILSNPWIFIGFLIIIYAIGEVLSILINNILNTILICKGNEPKKFKEVKAVEMNVGDNKNDSV